MNKTPEKPKTTKTQIEMIWSQCFNHIPSRLKWLDLKLNFVLVFMGLILALLAVIILT